MGQGVAGMSDRVEIGDAVLYHGDCMDVLADIGSFDAVVTSPPYNCGMGYASYDDAMPVADYFRFIEDVYAATARKLRAGGYAAWNIPVFVGSRGDQVFALDEFKPIADRHLRFADLIVWDKGPPNGCAWGNPDTSPRIRVGHEWVMVHGADGKRASRGLDISEWSALTQSPWRIQANLPLRLQHPATFPVELPTRLTKLYSPACGLVFDPFMGTGTTAEACAVTGRRFVGAEIDREYFDIACERIAAAHAQGRLFA